jgi:hypothetical protein
LFQRDLRSKMGRQGLIRTLAIGIASGLTIRELTERGERDGKIRGHWRSIRKVRVIGPEAIGVSIRDEPFDF